MSTIHSLKETLHDRIQMLEAAEDSMTRRGGVIHGPRGERYERGVIEGRLEEARVMFALVDQVAHSQATLAQERREHPLLSLTHVEFHDPNDPNAGPDTLAAVQRRREEAEPGIDRHDPGRC